MPRGNVAANGEEDMDVEVESLLGSPAHLSAPTSSSAPVKKSEVSAKPTTSRAAAQLLKAKTAGVNNSNQSDATVASYLKAKAALKSGQLTIEDALKMCAQQPATAVKRTAEKGDSPKKKSAQLDSTVLGDSDVESPPSDDNNKVNPRTVNTQKKAADLANKVCITSNVQITPPSTSTDAPNAHLFEKPAPLFLANVTDIMSILIRLDEAIGQANYDVKRSSNHGIRVQCKDIATYRKLVKYLDDNKVENYTFQLKSERGFRAIIRDLHYSTPDHYIREKLANLGHQVRFLRGIKSRFTKEPLDLFEVELAPSANNAEFMQITAIGNQRVKIEKPYKSSEVAQCHRCQKYGHTKNYCRRPFACVKCGGNHASTDCGRQKGEQTPAKCANCAGPHAASYKGCPSYKEACKKRENEGAHQIAKLINNLAKPAPTATAQRSRSNMPNMTNMPNLLQQVPPQSRPQTVSGPSYSAALRAGLEFAQPIGPAAISSKQRQSRQKATKRSQQQQLLQQQQQQQQVRLPRQASVQRPLQPMRSRSLSTRRRRPQHVDGGAHPNSGGVYSHRFEQPINANMPSLRFEPNQNNQIVELLTNLMAYLVAKFGPIESHNVQ
ncbi:hypothetical protein AWZ03_014547 [Drosophila navojoa]|uniref:Pre-C2HC domain-containing protein n=1 Tax=Drosophila navojoa TaxID=7232 RepID=A0A484ASH8_DRONA|nr:hypothetical protein AWZ03_014547 [Drosophila navojoa]